MSPNPVAGAGPRIDVSDVPVGAIRAVSETLCVVRTRSRVVAVERICPHAGADLAATGYVQDETLRCSWHNLPYDLGNGRQPCASLADLKVYELREAGDGSYLLVDEVS